MQLRKPIWRYYHTRFSSQPGKMILPEWQNHFCPDWLIFRKMGWGGGGGAAALQHPWAVRLFPDFDFFEKTKKSRPFSYPSSQGPVYPFFFWHWHCLETMLTGPCTYLASALCNQPQPASISFSSSRARGIWNRMFKREIFCREGGGPKHSLFE